MALLEAIRIGGSGAGREGRAPGDRELAGGADDGNGADLERRLGEKERRLAKRRRGGGEMGSEHELRVRKKRPKALIPC